MTEFSTVIDMALVTIQDYKIDELYNKSPEQWSNYLNGFMGKAIAHFENVYNAYNSAPLSYNLTNRTFDNDLSMLEIMIMSEWIVYEWYVRNENNVLQMNEYLPTSDFKQHAKAQNISAKSEYRDRIWEKVNQLEVDYGLSKVDIKEWS